MFRRELGDRETYHHISPLSLSFSDEFPLHAAIDEGNLERVKKLVEKDGCDVSVFPCYISFNWIIFLSGLPVKLDVYNNKTI